MTFLIDDLRVAVRSLRRRPAFTFLAVTILALGIGANTAIFSIVDSVLLRSLPYSDPASLVVVFGDGSARGQANRLGASAGDFLDWREQAGVFAGLVAVRNESRRLGVTGEVPLAPLVHAVSADYFDVLGVRPLLGRGFAAGEDQSSAPAVVVLSYGLWQSAFGGDPEIVGRSIALDDRQHTVVGVLPARFHSAHFFSVQPGMWVPSPFSSLREERSTRDLIVYGRLAPGRTIGQAQSAMTILAARLAQEHPDTNERWSARLVPLREHAVGQFTRTGAILLGAVGLVLLIACANVANLTLARAAERTQEVALRTALGASRSRIVAQLLTESVLLSLIGGGLGALLAHFGTAPLASLIPNQAAVPFLDRVAVDGRVLLFTLAISIASGILFGLVPSRHATRADLVHSLREGGRGSLKLPARRLREALVTAEVALAVVIVSAAGLLLRSATGLANLDPGFDAVHTLKLRTSLRGEELKTPAARVAHYEELLRRLESVPGVASASAVSFEPPPVLAGGVALAAVRIELPGAASDAASAPSAIARAVMPGYFETLRMPILKGRGILRDDTATSRRVAVVSETMARRHFPGVDPIGRSFAEHGPRPQPIEIVGVVGDVISAGNDPTPQPTYYTPYPQSPVPILSVVMRVPSGDALGPAREAERVAWALPGTGNVYAIESLERRVADLNWRTRFSALLIGGFAALALTLGAFGIYAVVSYTVAQRRGEIGLRMALGASAADVVRLILRGSLASVLTGLFCGSLVSLAVGQGLAGLLYGVRPGDPATHAAVVLLLLLVATTACLVPALRASHFDPQAALKE